MFGVFIVATLTTLDLSLLAPDGYPPVRSIVSSVALTFFAYLGFAVISFAAGDLRRPERNLPRAMYIALGVTTLLYVAIAMGVFGTLTVPEVVEYGLARSPRRPGLPSATPDSRLWPSPRCSQRRPPSQPPCMPRRASPGTLADVGQFPTAFGTASRLGRHGGLWITSVLTLLFVTVFDLGALASIGSAVSLAVFVLVGVAAVRLRGTIGARLWVLLAGIVCSVIALVVFARDTFESDPKAFWTMILLPFLALGIDLVWHRRPPPARAPSLESSPDRAP